MSPSNFVRFTAKHKPVQSTRYSGYLSFLNTAYAKALHTALTHRSFTNDDFQWLEVKDEASDENYKLSLQQESPFLWVFIALLGGCKLRLQPVFSLKYGHTLTFGSSRSELELELERSKVWLLAVGFRQKTLERLAEEFPILAPLKELSATKPQDWLLGETTISARLRSILEALRRFDFRPYSGPIMLAAWSLRLLNYMLQESKSPTIEQPEHSDIQNYHRAVQYIRANYRQDLTLDKLAEAIHISVRSLTRSFEGRPHTVTGLILHLKLTKARELIAFTEQPINDIAYSLHFSCPKYFSNSFKQKYRKSPRAYRTEMTPDRLGLRKTTQRR